MAGDDKISKCQSQKMSRASQQMSNQQMSVGKCPVSKRKIGACPDTSGSILVTIFIFLVRIFNQEEAS